MTDDSEPNARQAPEPAADAGTATYRRWLRTAILYVLLAVAGYQVLGWLLHNLRGFLGMLFLAWLFSVTIEPVVDWFERRGWRRGAGTGLVLVSLLLFSIGFLAVFGALLAEQLAQLLTALPGAVSRVTEWANRTFDTNFSTGDDLLKLTPDTIRELAQRFTPGVLGIVSSLLEVVFQAMTLLLFVFYMSAQGPALRRTISSWFPARQQQVISTVWEISVDKAGGYVVSRLILAAVSAVATGIFLMAIGVPYWLPLAIWTGVVSQFIPTLGTYLAIALPAIIAAAAQPMDGVWVVVFGTAYQQVENYLLHPRITSKTVSIHPAVAFGSVIVGASLFGAIGALVSVPVVAVIQSLVETYGRRYELVHDRQAERDAPAAE
ncbi:putative PurR-regulated permease PerM [Rhodococcus sp. PvR044]|uniref:AI-2E family transporter n=1 Tax=unclassified Rhodococcus (in: high G+C Gram-positive bacteria) TaxID=192944 RepID=UPI000BD63201|nr:MULTISPECIES: AI-2E family transporter [unclassified Rhodococcus (in: high G+C Gram-positive bacteria)]MBP1158548.1 putative PurR-regulated permease PerM [Rhodococcus sp. PvR099]PTR45598.1 putative PurR-regulated permease PerM [Rhodococcus sp. OK611]SNX89148.1 Predicted PurR-regulated permease PerM [Rhodococcus sp. OK270]